MIQDLTPQPESSLFMSYQISPTSNAKFMFKLKAENNQVILTSQV